MEQLLHSLRNLLVAGWDVVISVISLVAPWSPLIAWIGFWLLAVNWEKLYPVLARGAAVGVLLIGLMMILIWGLIAPPVDGVHHLFGLNTSNFVGKTVYVTALLTIAALCGSVQLSGACGPLAFFPEETPEDHHGGGHHDDHHGGHGDSHAGHEHDSHGHH